MGFFAPAPPPFEVEEWKQRPHLKRIEPLAQDWAENGFGSPYAVYLLYLVKLVIYAAGGLLVISASTPGLGGLGEVGAWWTEPIVFQKAVIWTLLWEVLGLGAGSMPLTLRFSPMIGGFLYWLRPGTTRLPPWPDRVPLTRGNSRTVADVAIYAALIAAALYLLAEGEAATAAGEAAHLAPGSVAALLGILALLGLRDKVSFLAARPEIYGTLSLIFLFPVGNMAVAAQLVFVFIWWGAAASKLNRHFPFVVTVMVSNTPWNRFRRLKRLLYRDPPEDIRPSRAGASLAHLGTVMEFTLPLILLTTGGGTLATIALAGMVIFHLHILSTFPLAVPLEWNIFMIFGLLFLFGQYGDVPLSTLSDPLLIGILAVLCLGLPVLGNLRPDLVSFLPAMRYYAGNWATSQWLFRKDAAAEQRLDVAIEKPARIVSEQLAKFYDRDTAEWLLYKGLAFRSMHSHGRALNGLTMRAAAAPGAAGFTPEAEPGPAGSTPGQPRDTPGSPGSAPDPGAVEAYDVREGELVAGVVLGYNFGDGHFHDHRLLEAVQERCRYRPGEVRVVTLESQPAHRQRQRYRIFDAADGLIEEGFVEVAEMVSRQPWLGDEGAIPVQVSRAPAQVDGRSPK